MAQHFSRNEINAMPSEDLRAIVESTNPTGDFAAEVVWATEEIRKRKFSTASLGDGRIQITRIS